MLRISFAQENSERRWTLCGQLAGPWVDELRTSWEKEQADGADSRSIVDLSDVTFIDESGERLLSDMGKSGVKFVAAGVATKHLLDHLKGKGERPLRRLTDPYSWTCCRQANEKQK